MTSTALQLPPAGNNQDHEARRHPVQQPRPCRYGWRFERVRTADGGFELREIPLTWQDLLDPKEGDYLIQATVHTQVITDLLCMLGNHFRDRDDVAVFHDLKMLWGIPGLSQPAPDIAVVANIRDKGRDRASFDVAREGTRPCLIIEVVSPEYRNKDYRDLPPIYQRAGIDEYLIVDPGPLGSDAPLRLSGYRLDAGGRYRRMDADAGGRLFAATTDLYFGSDPAHRRVLIEDAANGEPLLTPDQQQTALEESRRRATEEAAARRALEAELERLRKDAIPQEKSR